MTSPVEKWISLDHLCKPQDNDYSYAVQHSFARGRFRDVAEKVVVPKMVLDKIIKGSTSSWTEAPGGREEREFPTEMRVGGAGACLQMQGVKLEYGVGCRPKGIGRARALHIRAQKASSYQQLRKPGSKVSRCQASALASARNADCARRVVPVSYDHEQSQHHSHHEGLPHYKGKDYSSDCCKEYVFLSPTFSSSMSPTSSVSTPHSISFGRSNSTTKLTSDLSNIDSMCTSPSLVPIPNNTVEQSSCAPHPTLATLSLCNDMRVGLSDEDDIGLDWPVDQKTLLFSNLPETITVKDLMQCIEPFGSIANCTLVSNQQSLEGGREGGVADSNTAAYVRMEEGRTCEWVISYFHGNSLENSGDPVSCVYAFKDQQQ